MNNGNDFWKERLEELSQLDKPSRISEILFGLIMVLSFTCTIGVTSSGKEEVKELLWAAIGCNLAWGIIDAIMYLMNELIERSRSLKILNKIMVSEDKKETVRILRENIPPFYSALMDNNEIEKLGLKIKNLPSITSKRSLTFKDFLTGGVIFLLVFLITFPVAVPFLFISDVSIALRVSNGVALALMFAGGFTLARYSGLRPVPTGIIYSSIGIALVALAIALGG